MAYSEDILKQVRRFGVLQYEIDKIIRILQPDNPDQMRKDLKDEDSIIYSVYKQGFDTGQYNLDAQQFKVSQAEAKIALAEAEKLERENKELEELLLLRKQLFGI